MKFKLNPEVIINQAAAIAIAAVVITPIAARFLGPITSRITNPGN